MKTQEQVIKDIRIIRDRFEDGAFLYVAPHQVVIESMELYINLLKMLQTYGS